MRKRLLGAAALVLVLVSGCSDDAEPDVADPTSTPSASTPTAIEPTSEPPSSTATPEPESAEDFIRRWHRAGDSMQATGETATYLAMGPSCQVCADTAALIAGYYEAGGFVRYEGTRVTRIKKLGDVGKAIEFEVERASPPTRYKESSDGPVMTFKGGDDRIRMKIVRENGEWTVTEVGLLAP